MPALDVTDATFQAEVLERSKSTPVVVDLWAPWCGPCKTLGPVLEKVVDATNGAVVLAKINVDESPVVAQQFQVQSIPAVYAVKDSKVVDGFIGAQGEPAVQAFVDRLLPSGAETEVAGLLAVGDIPSLRHALELDPDNEQAIVRLAELLVGDDRSNEALDLLARIPETPETRHIAALARSGGDGVPADIDDQLEGLLPKAKDDDDARQQFVDLLELLGPDDPRAATWRRKLTAQLF